MMKVQREQEIQALPISFKQNAYILGVANSGKTNAILKTIASNMTKNVKNNKPQRYIYFSYLPSTTVVPILKEALFICATEQGVPFALVEQKVGLIEFHSFEDTRLTELGMVVTDIVNTRGEKNTTIIMNQQVQPMAGISKKEYTKKFLKNFRIPQVKGHPTKLWFNSQTRAGSPQGIEVETF